MKWLLDPGHGGMTFGEYLTPGKRSPEVPPGIYEGEFNRAVCALIQARDPEHIITIAPGPINVPLKARVSYVNQVCRRLEREPYGFSRSGHLEKKVALISVHANADDDPGWTDANGFRVFLSKIASDNSVKLGRMVARSMSTSTPMMWRETVWVNHTITTKTKCPAVLVECGFMTHRQDARYLASYVGQHTISDAIYQGMKDYEAQF